MITFLKYLVEEKEGKLTHIEHLADLPINDGVKGYNLAVDKLWGVHKNLRGRTTPIGATVKFDGAPSIVFGHHPENGKFFVATKSAFNKTPKLNYSFEDIERNHGHAPGLVKKLKEGLTHLPKVTPSKGVFQGDFMYSHDELEHSQNKLSFKPNTIKYSVKKDSERGKKILASKIGIVVHTAYHGDTFAGLKAGFNPDHGSFTDHPDVHIISPHYKFDPKGYTPELASQFKDHMAQAARHFASLTDDDHNRIADHKEPLKRYINHAVVDGHTPSTDRYVAFARSKPEFQNHGTFAAVNPHSFHRLFALHNSLTGAVHTLEKVLSRRNEFDHRIGNKKSKPEGYVILKGNTPSKLINRAEFSASNLAGGRFRKK